MNELMVAGTEIRKDEQGRYCLNDLYRASGGANRHRPSLWLRHKQTQELISEIEKPGHEKARISAYSTTQNAGAYVVKELVYAYAMWISPAFHLRVIRAYDALVTGRIDELSQPLHQVECYWFERRPHWPPIRVRVLAGETYLNIAIALKINRSRVARAVKSMIRVGLLSPAKVAEVQSGPARKAALRYGEGWGQMPLFG